MSLCLHDSVNWQQGRYFLPVQMQLSAEQPFEASEGKKTLKSEVHLCLLC